MAGVSDWGYRLGSNAIRFEVATLSRVRSFRAHPKSKRPQTCRPPSAAILLVNILSLQVRLQHRHYTSESEKSENGIEAHAQRVGRFGQLSAGSGLIGEHWTILGFIEKNRFVGLGLASKFLLED